MDALNNNRASELARSASKKETSFSCYRFADQNSFQSNIPICVYVNSLVKVYCGGRCPIINVCDNQTEDVYLFMSCRSSHVPKVYAYFDYCSI